MELGRYETLRTIATGGMATVYLGRSVGAGGFERLVAIKVMHPHIAGDPDFVSMFLDEARLAARIRHPNVAGTLDIQVADENLFIVMDYVEGPSLGQILRHMRKQELAVPVGMSIRIFLDVCGGLHAAHDLTDEHGNSLHLVHRDVSPPNILVGHEGVTRIVDFGVARANSRIAHTRGGQVKGKLQYMSPEQAKSEEVDRRSDIYASAVVLWEALTGQRLFYADNDAALAQMIVAGVSTSPREANPKVPQAISDACMRALALDPNDRYSTALAFADGLEDAARTEGVTIPTARTLATFVRSLDLVEGANTIAPATSRPSARVEAPTPPGDVQIVDTPSVSTNGSTSGTVMSNRPPRASRLRSLLIPASISAAVGILLAVIAVYGPWSAAPTPAVVGIPGTSNAAGSSDDTTAPSETAPPPATIKRGKVKSEADTTPAPIESSESDKSGETEDPPPAQPDATPNVPSNGKTPPPNNTIPQYKKPPPPSGGSEYKPTDL